MPPAPTVKPARASMYAYKKRSVSPTAPQPCTQKKSSWAAKRSTNEPPKHSDDGYFYENSYREELISYMHEIERDTLPSADFMDLQPELQWYMRPYLVDFLVEIHSQFRLRPEVLYLAINITDRYVSKRVVYKKHYQLVGCAALWIAAKFEDSKDRIPMVKELADMCCKAYEESAFIQMEGHVLSTIGWIAGHPTAEGWLRSYLTHANSRLNEDPRVQHMSRFLMEITLFYREFVGVPSSLVAWGALTLARYICGKYHKLPPAHIEHYDSITIHIAETLDKHFHEHLDTISDIVIRKYSPSYFMRASTTVREFYLQGYRYSATPTPPATPVSAPLSSSGLATLARVGTIVPKSMTYSPGASFSSASSDAGDEPLTPITPIHAQLTVLDYVADAKENIAPVGHADATAIVKEAAMPPPSSTRPVLHVVQ